MTQQPEKKKTSKYSIIVLSVLIIAAIPIGIHGFNKAKKVIVYGENPNEQKQCEQAVREWMQNNLNDPDSMQIIQWGTAYLYENDSMKITVKYRAKNPFGAYVITNTTFHLSPDGKIINVENDN